MQRHATHGVSSGSPLRNLTQVLDRRTPAERSNGEGEIYGRTCRVRNLKDMNSRGKKKW